jgi:peptidoglycan hydrolase CwlO-like protein
MNMKRIVTLTILIVLLAVLLFPSCAPKSNIPPSVTESGQAGSTLTSLQLLNAKMDSLLSQQASLLNEVKKCQEQIKSLQTQVNVLNGKIK